MLKLAVLDVIVLGIFAAGMSCDAAQARTRRTDMALSETNGVPDLNVKGSCADAQKFSSGEDKKLAYTGCLQDEMNAKSDLSKRWSTFKSKDRSTCVEQARYPSPSYVEVLTCLEMSSGTFIGAPRFGGQPVPQVGGPVAPSLSKPVDGEAPTQ